MSVSATSGLKPWNAVESLDKAAKALHQAADEAAAEVRPQVKAAGASGAEALSQVGGAVVNVTRGAAHAVVGTAALIDANAAAAVGIGAGAVGAGSWVVEKGGQGIAWVAHNNAKGLVRLSNFLHQAAGSSERSEITAILGDPTAEKLSKKLFRFAGDSIELGADFADFSFDEYAKSFEFGVLGTAGNVVLAAGNAGMMCVHLGAAAAMAGDAAAIKMAELGVRTAKVSVQAAQEGVDVAADATLIAAKASAAVGNFLAHPADKSYKITPAQIAAVERELQALAA